MNDFDIILKIATAVAAGLAAWMSLRSKAEAAEAKAANLQMEIRINSHVDLRFRELDAKIDTRLREYVPRAECDISQRMAEREIGALTEQVRSVDDQLRNVEHKIRRVTEEQ